VFDNVAWGGVRFICYLLSTFLFVYLVTYFYGAFVAFLLLAGVLLLSLYVVCVTVNSSVNSTMLSFFFCRRQFRRVVLHSALQ